MTRCPATVLIAVAWLVPAAAPAQTSGPPPGRWAFVAGAATEDPASAAAQDDVVRTLVDRFGYTTDRVTVLSGGRATQSAIREELQRLMEKLHPRDSLLVSILLPHITRRGETFIMPAASSEAEIWTLLRREDIEQIVARQRVASVLLIVPDCGGPEQKERPSTQQSAFRPQASVSTVTYCAQPSGGPGFDQVLAQTLKSSRSETGRLTVPQLADDLRTRFGTVHFEAMTWSAGSSFELVEEGVRSDTLFKQLSAAATPDDRAAALKPLVALGRGAGVARTRDAVSQRLVAIAADAQQPAAVRLDVINALGEIGGDTVVAGIGPLSGAAATPDVTLRRAIVAALGRIRTPETLPLLQHAFADPSATVRVAALIGVASHPSLTSPVLVIGRLGDSDADVRVAALQILANLARPPDGRPNMVTPVAGGARRAVESHLKDKEAAVRREAINTFAALGADLTASDAMIELLEKDPDATVRAAAALFIGRLYRGGAGAGGVGPSDTPREKRILDALIRAAEPVSPTDVRTAAMWSLGEIGGARAAQALTTYLDDPDPRSKQASVEALGRCSWAPAVPTILPMLADRSPRLRAAAATSLGQMHDTRAHGPLLEILSGDSDPFVRSAAESALHALPSPALGVTVQALQNPSPRVRLEAVEQLAVSKEPPAAAAVIEALGDEDASVREVAEQAVKTHSAEWRHALEDALASGRGSIRFGVARAFGAIGDGPSVAALLARVSTEQNPIVRVQILASLGAAVTPTPEIEDALLFATANPDVAIRSTAARALGAYSDARAVERLKKLAEEETPDVRDSAVESLRRINKL